MLSAILTDVNATLTTLFNAAHPGAVPPLQVLAGSEFLEGQDAANRVVWVPTHDRYEGPKKQTSGAGATAIGGIPRSLRTRWMRLEAHLWGEPPAAADPTGLTYFDSVDDLIQWVTIALQENVPGDFKLVDGGYPAKQSGSGYTTYGREYILVVEFDTPIVDQAVTTVVLDSIPLTESFA